MEEKVLKKLSPSASRVQEAINAAGFDCQVLELSESTKTAQEAAYAIGCEVGQIVKSLVFRGKTSGKGIFVAASGANRVSEKLLKLIAGEAVEKATPEFVREKTGFAIGGVPPVGHLEKCESYVDEDLLQYEEIWAAAGTPNALFRLTASELLTLTGGSVVSIKQLDVFM